MKAFNILYSITVAQNGLWSEVSGGSFSRPWGSWTGGPVNWKTVRVTGSPGPQVSQRGCADGVLSESVLTQVDGCHPRFATAGKQVASPSPAFPQGSPSLGNPWGPIPAYMHVCTCAHVLTYAHITKRVLARRGAQWSPAPGD